MLEATQLFWGASGRRIVDGVSLRVRAGEFVAIIGPNGAGKSSLLRLMAGHDLTPAAGTLTLDGRKVADLRSDELARRRAFLAQEQRVHADLRAGDLVMLGRSPHIRIRETQVDVTICHDSMDLFGASELWDRSYPTLSGGEKQRIALARAAAQVWESDADRYLLLDEPTNNLDLRHQHGALIAVRNLASRGIGVVVVLHDITLAGQYADRICVLHRGKIVSDESPAVAISAEMLRGVFGVEAIVETRPDHASPLVVSTGPVARE